MGGAALHVEPPRVSGASLGAGGAGSVLPLLQVGSVSSGSYADGLASQATFQAPLTPATPMSGELKAYVGDRAYLTTAPVATLAEAATIVGLLRTPTAFIDRSVVLVTFQLLDAARNVRVSVNGLSVDLTLSFTGNGAATSNFACNLAGVDTAVNHYTGSCNVPSLPTLWFGGSAGSAEASLTAAYGGTTVATTSCGTISLVGQPSWIGGLDSLFTAATCVARARSLAVRSSRLRASLVC